MAEPIAALHHHHAEETTVIPRREDFSSEAYSHETVRYEAAEQGSHRRFHLLFAYIGQNGVASGDQVVMASDIGQAAVRIMSERSVNQLMVRKRYYSNKPANEADIINRVFDLAA